jgi:hypothetical protein
MTTQELQAQRHKLFDENFNCISNDLEMLLAFSDELKARTGIQVANKYGMMYEYLPQVYKSAVSLDK